MGLELIELVPIFMVFILYFLGMPIVYMHCLVQPSFILHLLIQPVKTG